MSDEAVEMAIYRQVQTLDISISVSILYRFIGIDCVRYLSGKLDFE